MGIVELCFFAMDYTFGVTEFGAAAYARRSPRGELALKIFLEFFRKSLTGFGAYKTVPILASATNLLIFPAQIESNRPINKSAALNLDFKKGRRPRPKSTFTTHVIIFFNKV